MPIVVTLHELLYAGPKQTALIRRATSRLQEALNHADFAERVIEAEYRQRRWRSTDGRVEIVSPKDVVARIRAGRERATPIDGEIDLRIHLRKFKKPTTLGATVLGQLPIRTAYRFIDRAVDQDDVANPAGHFIHEWLHVSGFFHYPNNKARKDVPYNVGNIVRSILEDRFGERSDPTLAKALDDYDCGSVETERELDDILDNSPSSGSGDAPR